MYDIAALHRIRPILATALLLAVIPAAAGAQPFAWSVPSGTETWSIGHVHTVLWSGGPASQVNLHLIAVPANVVAQTVVVNDVNDGERVFRLSASLAPGTYVMYIEDTAQTTWTYGPEFQIAASDSCVSPCTGGALGAPALVCGQTQAQAEALAIGLAQSQIGCGMAGNVDPNSIAIETTLLAVGAYPCPSGYSGAYAVEASALWCCCPEPVGTQSTPWSRVKMIFN